VIPKVTTASWSSEIYSENTLGILAHQINDGDTGYAIINGILENIDTSGASSGDILYLSGSGDFSKNKTVAPNNLVIVGQVIKTDPVSGSIYVRVQNGYELDELHDVLISDPKQDGDLLIRSGSLWKNSHGLTGSYELNGTLSSNGGITSSAGFYVPGGVVSTMNVTYAVTSSRLFGSEKYAETGSANTFTANNQFTTITASHIYVSSTASIAHLETINQTSLNVGDKYIVILSASNDHTSLDGAGLLWGTSSSGPTTDPETGANAYIKYSSVDQLVIYPGLKVSGSLTASAGSLFTSVTASSHVSASNY